MRIKRVSLLIITAIYFVSICGISGSNFYCCGKLKQTYLFTHLNPEKDCKGENKTPHCCDTKVFFAKVKDNHSPSTQLKVNTNDVSTLLFGAVSVNINTCLTDVSSITYFHHPPPLSELPVYLSYNSFRV
jgi:hypothetical protein